MSASVPLRELRFDAKAAKPVPKGPEHGRGIVPLQPFNEQKPTEDLLPAISFHSKCDAPSSTTTSSDGGAPLASTSVDLLFWGSQWTKSPSPPIGQVKSACAQIIEGPYMLALGQYGVGPGRLVGSSIIPNYDPPNPFTDDDVQNLLLNLAGQGLLNLQNLSMVILPANFASNLPNVGGLHSYIGTPIGPIFYAWLTHNGTLNSLTPIFSHELAEACTDPGGDGLQVNPRNSSSWHEICDVCCSATSVNGVLVSSYWSQQNKACVVPRPFKATARSALTCFGVDNTYTRLYYLAGSDDVNELANIPGWQNRGFSAAKAGSPLTCHGVNGTDSRVYFLDSGNHVIELGWNTAERPNAWGSNDITKAAPGAPAAVSGSALACYGVNGADSRVYYRDSSQHVIELGWNTTERPNAWDSNDITKEAPGAPAAVSGSALACYGVNGTDTRVYCLDPSQHVIELGWNRAERPNAWGSNEITKAAPGAPAAVGGSALACYGVNGADSRVYYRDPSQHVIELGWNTAERPNAWGSDDITKATGAAPTASDSDLACYGVFGQQSRVYYLDANHALNEMAWNNGWVNHLL